MVCAELMGGHSHTTLCGINVHVYRRGDLYLARGRYQGRMYGEPLGTTEAEATSRLRQVLVAIEDGTFVRRSEARQRLLTDGRMPRLNLRQIANEFLAEKRKARGRSTAAAYRSRLRPVLDFAELPDTRRRWPLAMDINRDFVAELRVFLYQYPTTRNGRAGGRPQRLSVRQIQNVLECLRSVLGWARQAEVRKLPVDWANPLTADLIPTAAPKDPLREDPLPLEARIKLVGSMDRWQLCHLALSVVLPLRPAEAAGLLVGEVRFDKGWLEIGTRLHGGDFTKGQTSFKLPFPDALRPILHVCIGGRGGGPLLRSRAAFGGKAQRPVASPEELSRWYEERLAKAPPGSVQTEQDRKGVFRRLLRDLGGVSEDRLAAEFKQLLRAQGRADGVSLYTLRSSVTTAMERVKMGHLELRYLTGHATGDILNEYVTLDPVGAMQLYFAHIRPLLTALTLRAQAVGLLPG
jgi:integrase